MEIAYNLSYKYNEPSLTINNNEKKNKLHLSN